MWSSVAPAGAGLCHRVRAGALRRMAAALVGSLVCCGALVSPARAAAPVGQWKFDEGTGTIAADAAGAHPATLTGGGGWGARLVGPRGPSGKGTNGGARAGAPGVGTSPGFRVTAGGKMRRGSGFQKAGGG